MKTVYENQCCRGAVTASFGADRKKVIGCFGDGEFAGANLIWQLEKTDNGYRIAETTRGYPSIIETEDGHLRLSPDTTEYIEIGAKTQKHALKEMAKFIAGKYQDKGIGSYPVDARELEQGLMEALIA